MFRPYMAIIRFFSLKVSLYKLREKGCDVEISHQIIVLVCLCIGGYYITHTHIYIYIYCLSVGRGVLWPARATTKISLAAPRHPLADPIGWEFLRGMGGNKRSTA